MADPSHSRSLLHHSPPAARPFTSSVGQLKRKEGKTDGRPATNGAQRGAAAAAAVSELSDFEVLSSASCSSAGELSQQTDEKLRTLVRRHEQSKELTKLQKTSTAFRKTAAAVHPRLQDAGAEVHEVARALLGLHGDRSLGDVRRQLRESLGDPSSTMDRQRVDCLQDLQRSSSSRLTSANSRRDEQNLAGTDAILERQTRVELYGSSRRSPVLMDQHPATAPVPERYDSRPPSRVSTIASIADSIQGEIEKIDRQLAAVKLSRNKPVQGRAPASSEMADASIFDGAVEPLTLRRRLPIMQQHHNAGRNGSMQVNDEIVVLPNRDVNVVEFYRERGTRSPDVNITSEADIDQSGAVRRHRHRPEKHEAMMEYTSEAEDPREMARAVQKVDVRSDHRRWRYELTSPPDSGTEMERQSKPKPLYERKREKEVPRSQAGDPREMTRAVPYEKMSLTDRRQRRTSSSPVSHDRKHVHVHRMTNQSSNRDRSTSSSSSDSDVRDKARDRHRNKRTSQTVKRSDCQKRDYVTDRVKDQRQNRHSQHRRSRSSSSEDTSGRLNSMTRAGTDAVQSKQMSTSTERKAETRRDIKPNKFNGRGCVETFIAQFTVCAEHNRWSETEKAAQLKCCLTEDAGQLVWDSGSPADITYAELAEKLKRRYGSLDQQERYKAQLRARRRSAGEPLAKIYQDIRGLMTRAYPGQSTSDMGEQMARDHFLTALNDKEFELKVRERFPNTLDEAFKQSVQLEALQDTVDASVARDAARNRHRNPRDDGIARRVAQLEQRAVPTVVDYVEDQRGSEVAEMKRKMDEMSKELGRLRALQPRTTVTSGPSQVAAPRSDQSRPPIASAPAGDRRLNSAGCFNCGAIGHFARHCPETRTKQRATQQDAVVESNEVPPTVRTVMGTSTPDEQKRDRKTYVRLNVNGVMRRVLLDTGSDATLLPSFAVTGAQIQECNMRLFAANGTAIRVKGRATVEAFMGQHKFQISGLVTDHVAEVMLGFDCLKEHSAIWNFQKDEVEFDGWVHTLCAKEGPTWCRRVILQSDSDVPAKSEVVLPTKVVYNDLTQLRSERETCWITEARTLPCGLKISRAILPDDDVNVPVRALNTLPHAVSLPAGTVLSVLEPVEPCYPDESSGVSETLCNDPTLIEMVNHVDPSVVPENRQKLLKLLSEFSGTFSHGVNDLGRTDVVSHSIDTGQGPPFRQPLRRYPPAHLDAIRQHVSDMLDQGVIERARSPWASNVVLVKKKDGSLRCCIDYRQLNNQTRKDAYPLPRTDMCLDAMHGASWFSTFDLRSSYHQVGVDEADRDKTSFICREGQFRFCTMPFGLCNAGATFQRLMDVVMSGLTFEVCLIYLDDVIVFSSTIGEHFVRLKLVLHRLQQAGLKLKPSKCHLLQKSVEFLGHVVSEGQIGVNPEKVQAVVDWPIPVSVKEVRGFVGLCSYYRRFVRNFGSIAAPLTALTEKNRIFRWTEECQTAFEVLKRLLTSAPLLAMPNDVDTFTLDTDASQCAIGGVLSQLQDDVERPIAYASRKLSKAEINYCVTRKELLAVVYFLKYFRHYLLGRRFKIRTDHAALQWLRRTPDPVGQQARWIGFMEDFNYEIIHRPGSRHGNADAMSRRPCRLKGCRCHSESDESCTVCGEGDKVRTVKVDAGQETDVTLACQPTEANRASNVSENDSSSSSVINDVGLLTETAGTSFRVLTASERTDSDFGEVRCAAVDKRATMRQKDDVVVGDASGAIVWERNVLRGLEGGDTPSRVYVVPSLGVIVGTPECVLSTSQRLCSASKATELKVQECEEESDEWTTDDQVDEVEIRAVEVDAPVEYRQEIFDLEVLRAEQRVDTDVCRMMKLKEQNKDKPPWDVVASSSPTLKALWQQWDRIEIRGDLLYRRYERLDGKPDSWQIVVPFKLRRTMFRLVHEGMAGGHMGRKRTELQLQTRAYWPGWAGDVRRFLKMCAPCEKYHRGKPPRAASLTPFPVGDAWEVMSIDVTGPHPRSKHGNVYILTVIDHFSKWADAFPVPNHTASTVSRVLYNRVFVYFGCPLRILSDQGPEFESHLFQDLCQSMEIEKIRTTPYKPSTNGMVERYHRTLNTILAKTIASNQRDWCEKVPIAAAAYRASTHEATGFSPNYLVLGRENRMPIDLVLGMPTNADTNRSCLDDSVEHRQEMIQETYTIVREHLERAANRRKKYYDIRVRNTDTTVGTWVWYLYPRRRTGLSPKWQNYYTGPYLIVRIIQPNNLVIQKSKRSKQFVVHRDKVKVFCGDAPKSWIVANESLLPQRQDVAFDERRKSQVGNSSSIESDGDRAVTAEPSRAPDATTRTRRRRDEVTTDADDIQLPDCPNRPGDSGADVHPDLSTRPSRDRHKPGYLTNYICRVVSCSMENRGRAKCRARCACTTCGRIVSRPDSLRRHQEACHRQETTVMEKGQYGDQGGRACAEVRPRRGSASHSSTSRPESGLVQDDAGQAQQTRRSEGTDKQLDMVAVSFQKHTTSSIVSRESSEASHRCHVGDTSPLKETTARNDIMPNRRAKEGDAGFDRRIMIAASVILGAGPSLPVKDATLVLRSPPHNLTEDLARAVTIASRYIAHDLATRAVFDSRSSATAYSNKALVGAWAHSTTATGSLGNIAVIDSNASDSDDESLSCASEERSMAHAVPSRSGSQANEPKQGGKESLPEGPKNSEITVVRDQRTATLSSAKDSLDVTDKKKPDRDRDTSRSASLSPLLPAGDYEYLLESTRGDMFDSDVAETYADPKEEGDGGTRPVRAVDGAAVKRKISRPDAVPTGAKPTVPQDPVPRTTTPAPVTTVREKSPSKKDDKGHRTDRRGLQSESGESQDDVSVENDVPRKKRKVKRKEIRRELEEAKDRETKRDQELAELRAGMAMIMGLMKKDKPSGPDVREGPDQDSRMVKFSRTAAAEEERQERGYRAPSNPERAEDRHRSRSESPRFSTSPNVRREAELTSNVLSYYPREKEKWTITVPKGTGVLVLGDSNMRAARRVPGNWKIVALSGARVPHVSAAIQRTPRHLIYPVTRVYILVGMNHRGDRYPPTTALTELEETLKTFSTETVYVGVSYGRGLTIRETAGLERFNQEIKQMGDGYIPPIPTRDVREQEGDPVHYASSTVQKIVEQLVLYQRHH